MTARALALAGAGAALAVGTTACVAHRPAETGAQRVFGEYRCTLAGPEGAPPQFRILLFAELPDRLHVEALGPLGGPRWILDAGDGSMCVTLVAERIAYAGLADPEVLSRVLGLPVRLDDLVDGILRGSWPAGAVSLARVPEKGEGLPERLELTSPGRSIRIVRASRRSVRTGSTLGRGAPPPGVEVRPLETLGAEASLSWVGGERKSP